MYYVISKESQKCIRKVTCPPSVINLMIDPATEEFIEVPQDVGNEHEFSKQDLLALKDNSEN